MRLVDLIESSDTELHAVVISHADLGFFVLNFGLTVDEFDAGLLKLDQMNVADHLAVLASSAGIYQVDAMVHGPDCQCQQINPIDSEFYFILCVWKQFFDVESEG